MSTNHSFIEHELYKAFSALDSIDKNPPVVTETAEEQYEDYSSDELLGFALDKALSEIAEIEVEIESALTDSDLKASQLEKDIQSIKDLSLIDNQNHIEDQVRKLEEAKRLIKENARDRKSKLERKLIKANATLRKIVSASKKV